MPSSDFWICLGRMIRGGFLSAQERTELVGLVRDGLVRDGLAEHRAARRANALLLLDDGWSCEKVAGALYLDDDTIRHGHSLFETAGVWGLLRFELGGSVGFLKEAQEAQRRFGSCRRCRVRYVLSAPIS